MKRYEIKDAYGSDHICCSQFYVDDGVLKALDENDEIVAAYNVGNWSVVKPAGCPDEGRCGGCGEPESGDE